MPKSPLTSSPQSKFGPHTPEKSNTGDWRVVGGPSPRSRSPITIQERSKPNQVASPPPTDPRNAFTEGCDSLLKPFVKSPAATKKTTWPLSSDSDFDEIQRALIGLTPPGDKSPKNEKNNIEKQLKPKNRSYIPSSEKNDGVFFISCGSSNNTNDSVKIKDTKNVPSQEIIPSSSPMNLAATIQQNKNKAKNSTRVLQKSNTSSNNNGLLSQVIDKNILPSSQEEPVKDSIIRMRSKSISHESLALPLTSVRPKYAPNPDNETEIISTLDESAVRAIWRRSSACIIPSGPSFSLVQKPIGDGIPPHRRASTFSSPALWKDGISSIGSTINDSFTPQVLPGIRFSHILSPPLPNLTQINFSQKIGNNNATNHMQLSLQNAQPAIGIVQTRPSHVTASQQTHLSPVMAPKNDNQYHINARSYDISMRYDQQNDSSLQNNQQLMHQQTQQQLQLQLHQQQQKMKELQHQHHQQMEELQHQQLKSQQQHDFHSINQDSMYNVPPRFILPQQNSVSGMNFVDNNYNPNMMFRRGTIAHPEKQTDSTMFENSAETNNIDLQRRHSTSNSCVKYYVPGRNLTEAFGAISLDGPSEQNRETLESSRGSKMPSTNLKENQGRALPAVYGGITSGSRAQGQNGEVPNSNHGSNQPRPKNDAFSEVGRGVPLHALPSTTPLFIVEFKAGRSDIYYVAESTGLDVRSGSLVIVEGDRGKDLGKVTSEISIHQVHMMQAQRADALSDIHRLNREIHPKRIFRHSNADEIVHLVTKSQDEAKALAVCQTKVRQKKLDMEVVDAEYQWDRRKLTFFFVATRRIDFRELVHDLFKIYKTRIWMNAVPERIATGSHQDEASDEAKLSDIIFGQNSNCAADENFSS